jgi:hypothetical protein
VTSEGNPSLADRLNNLGIMLGSWYKRTSEIKDLEEAIQVARLAVESMLEDHLNRAT